MSKVGIVLMSQAFPELHDFSDSPLEEGLSAPALAQSNIPKDGSPYQTRILFLYMHSETTKCHKLSKLHHRHTIALNDNILSTIVLNLVPLEGFQIWLIFAFS